MNVSVRQLNSWVAVTHPVKLLLLFVAAVVVVAVVVVAVYESDPKARA